MLGSIKQFVSKNRNHSMAFGLGLYLCGLSLAYITNDTEPWGTIGGFMAGISLFFVISVGGSKESHE